MSVLKELQTRLFYNFISLFISVSTTEWWAPSIYTHMDLSIITAFCPCYMLIDGKMNKDLKWQTGQSALLHPHMATKLRWDTTSVTYRRKGCKYHTCSSYLQRISHCLTFTRAKLCWTFINIQVLKKKLGHHSSSDYWTCSTEVPRSLLGVQTESAIFEKAWHREEWQFSSLLKFQ